MKLTGLLVDPTGRIWRLVEPVVNEFTDWAFQKVDAIEETFNSFLNFTPQVLLVDNVVCSDEFQQTLQQVHHLEPETLIIIFSEELAFPRESLFHYSDVQAQNVVHLNFQHAAFAAELKKIFQAVNLRLSQKISLHFLDNSSVQIEAPTDFSIIYSLTEILGKYASSFIGSETVERLKIGLYEVIRNAMEHGNLAISFPETTHLLENNQYYHRISEQKEKFGHRKVVITMRLLQQNDQNCIQFTVQDEGDGFNWQKTLESARNSLQEGTVLSHGRGLLIARHYFHEVSFNLKGNKVFLLHYFEPEKTS